MKRFERVAFALAIALGLGSAPAAAQGLCRESSCDDGDHSQGAVYRICMPEPGCWNGDLVVFAHGYVAFDEPIAIPEDQLEVGGVSLPALVNALGYGFATTSYRTNGLAVLEGVEDVVDLVDVFADVEGLPQRTYLVGASEGGLVTALGVERHPDVFSGGLAACGPVGDFQRQVNYWGDFRVLFDYFFPGVIPGSPVAVPEEVIENWETFYVPKVLAAFAARPAALDELLRVAKAPFDAARPGTKVETAVGLLWYNVFATNDGIQKLGGQPFDNRYRFYYGSSNDFLLNLRVRRFRAELAAQQQIETYYQTSGRLLRPIVTEHTTGDEIVPYWQAWRYRVKTLLEGSGLLHVNLPVLRYGHCQFEADEALFAFLLLVLQVHGQSAEDAVSPDLLQRFGELQLRLDRQR